jgi:hypothetical protein
MEHDPHCSHLDALKFATALCACFRGANETEERAFVPIFAAMFEQYPEWVGRQVVNPIHGLPSQLKFFPAIAEVKAACEEAYAHIRQAEEAERERAEHYRRFPLVIADKNAGPSDEVRERGVAHWFDEIRPTLAQKRPVYGPVEPPEAKLDRLQRTFWNETIVIGRDLAKKFPGWTEGLLAMEKRHKERQRREMIRPVETDDAPPA